MADNANKTDTNEQPDPQEQPTNPASGDTTSTGKTFTEAEVNAMIAARLTKHEKAVRKQLEEEQAEAKRQADLTAEERAKEAQKALEEAKEAHAAEVRNLKIRADLAGKVANPDAAMRLLEDDHVTEDGTVNLEAFLEAHPYMAPAETGKSVNIPSARSQGAPGKLSPEDFKGKDAAWVDANLHRLKTT